MQVLVKFTFHIESLIRSSFEIRNGIKEIKTQPIANDETIWSRELSNSTHISQFAKNMEPHEKRSVYIGVSMIPGSGEGIFAR